VLALPAFTGDGLLPVGDYQMTLEELHQSHLVSGRGVGSPNWDAVWRLRLVINLETLVEQLWRVGIDAIFVDGSFVEAKNHPNDIDGYFECDRARLLSGRLERELNALDPHKIWTWDANKRLFHTDSNKRELPMWHRYRVELWPHWGQSSGIPDEFGHPQPFPSAFRYSPKARRAKGIIRIVR